MGFSVAELGNTDGTVTLQTTGVQLYDPTNGLVTMTITTPKKGHLPIGGSHGNREEAGLRRSRSCRVARSGAR